MDAAGNLYVADRAQDVIVRLDPAGRVLDPRYVSVARPRLMAAGESGHLWIGSDGTAEAPWQRGIGEIVKAVNRGAWRVNEVLRISGSLDAPLRGR